MSSRSARGSQLISLIALLLLPGILSGQAPSANANDLQQHIAKAEQALRASDKSAAEREYNEILKIDPQNSQAWTGLGILLYGSGKPEEAIQALQSALKSNPGAKRAELFIGLSEAELHNCTQAIPILSKYFER